MSSHRQSGTRTENLLRSGCIFSCIIIILLLTAGCVTWDGGRNEFDQDLRIEKLDPDGLVIWTKEINSGGYDYALDFIETNDGGFLIVGGTSKIRCGSYPPPSPQTPRLTRLSASGNLVWERDYVEPIKAVAKNPDGSFSAVTDAGLILNIDAGGNVTGKHDPKIPADSYQSWYDIDSILPLQNGGYLIAGRTIAGIDPSGNLSWHQLNDTVLGETYALAEMKDTKGYLAVIFNMRALSMEILHLDRNGTILNETLIDSFTTPPPYPIIQKKSDGYAILGEDWQKGPVLYHLNEDGLVIRKEILANASRISGSPVVLSDDGTVISLDLIEPGTIVKKMSMNPDGTVKSESKTECSSKNRCPHFWGETILTSEGGFGGMGKRQTDHACWS